MFAKGYMGRNEMLALFITVFSLNADSRGRKLDDTFFEI